LLELTQEHVNEWCYGIYCTLERDSMATYEVRNDIQEKMSKAEYMAWKMKMINFKLHY